MRTILFVVGSATAYKIQKPFAEFCVQQGRAVAFVYDREPDALFTAIEKDAESMGSTATSLDAAIGAGPHESPWGFFTRPPARAKAFDQVRQKNPSPRMTAFADLIFGRLAAATAILKRLRPSVLVVAEDGVAGPLAMIAAAAREKIPVAVLPYGYGTQRDFEIALETKAASGELERPDGPCGEAIERMAPEWIKQGALAGSLLFPAEYIVALESATIRVNNAWVVHGGTADRLCVESPQMMRLYQSEGLSAEKLALTGTPYGDFVLDALDSDPEARAAFRQPRKISPGRTRILVSWPPSYHAERAARSEFETYLEMTRTVIDGLRALPDAEVTISLHPAVPADDRAAIEAMGVTLSDRYVLELIPLHDIYVSYYSSTIRWAIASGKPVLNYDAYQLELDVYDAAPGVITTSSHQHLMAKARELAADEVFARVAGEQVTVAADWGLLDQRAMPRILAELDRVIRNA